MTPFELGIHVAQQRNVPGHLKQAYAQGFAGALEKRAEDVRVYHGSPVDGIKTLRAGSYVTQDPAIASIMGLAHADGKTWTDDDLDAPYGFQGLPKWREGRRPTREPTVYELVVALKTLNLLNNPYEHTLLHDVPVQRQIAQQKNAGYCR